MREPEEKKELAQTLKTLKVKARKKGFVQCIIKQLLDLVFVISRIIKVLVRVISLSLQLQLMTPTSTLIILDITKTSSNNCLQLALMFVFVILSGSKHSSNENAEPSESEEAEKARALDADSSNDLKALFGQQTSTSSPLPTNHDSAQKVPSSKQSSKGQTVTTMPISAKTDEKPNRSFLEVSLGDIKPSAPEQNQMSSAVDVVGPGGTFKPSVLDDDDNGSKVGKEIALLKVY